ncbi:phospholipid-transporting ATPase ABCA1-like isoform X2 [Clavelina lepadiformis]|uniref:phospholipid-transporting ATPase ABCA1-like isoform X2 n=1 Tax=Clavelina lepadiformis TaxID=159417 RepID=UPI004041A6F3
MFWKHLYLLSWKNLLLRKRHWIQTLLEILSPLLVFGVLIVLRKNEAMESRDECHYQALAMPSAGLYPWFKSIVCASQNPCFGTTVASEVPGQINEPFTTSSNKSALSSLIRLYKTLNGNTEINLNTSQISNDLGTLQAIVSPVALSNFIPDVSAFENFLLTNRSLSPDVTNSILSANVSLIQVYLVSTQLGKTLTSCSEAILFQIFAFPNSSSNVTAASGELCNLTDVEVTEIIDFTQNSIDVLSEAASLLASVTSSFQEAPLVNATQYAVILDRFNYYLEELLILQGFLNEILEDVNSVTTTNIFNFDPSTAYSKLCGTEQSFSVDPLDFMSRSASSSNKSNSRSNQIDLGSLTEWSSLNSVRFCSKLFALFASNTQLSIAWYIFKPWVSGKIPFYPNTTLVKSIIERANTTFETIALFQSMGENWETEIGPNLYQLLETGTLTVSLRRLIDSTETLKSLAENTRLVAELLKDLSDVPSTNSTDQSDAPLNNLFQFLNDDIFAVFSILSNASETLLSISDQLNNTVETLAQLDSFLSNEDNPNDSITTWKDSYRQLNDSIIFITRLLSCVELNKFEGFDNEEDLVDYSATLMNKNDLWGSIVFENPTATDVTLPKIVKYKIRQNAKIATKTTHIRKFFWIPGPGSGITDVTYYINGFVHMQDLIENAIVLTSIGQNKSLESLYNLTFGKYLQQMPYPCHTSDRFMESLAILLPLIMTIAFIYSVCVNMKSIVYEKEERLKEVMKMMGLSNLVLRLSWFINAFILLFFSILLITIVLKVGSLTPRSNAFILVLWLCCFAFATIMQSFLICTFFSSANLAAACGGLIYFISYTPYNVVYILADRMSLTTKVIACLLSPVALGYGTAYLTQLETVGQGVQFSNWASSLDSFDEMNFLISMIMLVVDGVIYMLLTWYIENVFPGTYGVPQPWYFFLTKSYWCKTSTISNGGDNHKAAEINPDAKVENVPRDLKLGVSIHNLRKVYDNGKVAVDDLSMNFYEGQITSFLGHNGAGKTTTMSMLTGLFTPTSGTAWIYGQDIRNDMDQIRHQLGFCPQYNVLFGDLTVLEHLKFYAGLKRAVGGSSVDEKETEKMIVDVGLSHKRNELSRHLSGGMKRKLSVAVAFSGNSKCVILDEPTAGVDPYARRSIWDLLLSYRANRTILLSTHHMDEADLLGDRIAIISHGRLKCCGSSLFLKSCFGVGYYLTVVKHSHGSSTSETNRSLSSASVISEDMTSIATTSNTSSTQITDESTFLSLKKLVSNIIPTAKLKEEKSREIAFVLPYQVQTNGSYSTLLSQLDDRGLKYGLTDTSLEEIFLNVAEQSNEEEKEEKTNCCFCIPRRRKMRSGHALYLENQYPHQTLDNETVTGSSSAVSEEEERNVERSGAINDYGSQGIGTHRVSGKKLIWQQFMALFVKQFHNARKNLKGIVAQFIVPPLSTAIALAIVFEGLRVNNYPPLELQPWMYGDTNTFFSNNMPNNSLSLNVSDALLNSPSIGMRCVNDYNVQNYGNSEVYCNQGNESSNLTLHGDIEGYSQLITSENVEKCVCMDNQSPLVLAECVNGAGGEPTPRALTETSDWMYNMTGRNLSDWLVKTVDRFYQNRYGGLSVGETFHSSLDSNQILLLLRIFEANIGSISINSSGAELAAIAFKEALARTDNAKAWYNNNGYHAMPTWLNILNNAALRSLLPPGENPSDYGIVVVNHPFNISSSLLDFDAIYKSIAIMTVSVIFALSFIPASFVLFLIEEKVTKSKHLQFVSGVNQSVYWIANFMWDMVNYCVSVFILILTFLAFDAKAYVSEQNFPSFLYLLLLYGFAIIPTIYVASFFFETPSTAYIVLTCVNLSIGIASLIVEAISRENPQLKTALLFLPQYCMGRAIFEMSLNQVLADILANFDIIVFTPPLELVRSSLIALAIEGVLCFTLTLILQYRFFIGRRSGGSDVESLVVRIVDEQDDDVIAEKRRLLESETGDVLQVKNLTKVFQKRGTRKEFVAVNKLCVGVPEGECFGLLGVNGAGKTTTFKMLTGDVVPTAGDALICGHSILKKMRKVQQNIGYCPQFEALCNRLTGREHLIFYAKLRGVPPEEVDGVADWAINKFGLKMYADKPAGTYSGGNKRKLSAAIAFIGCPPIVFLDEPTAGMDPMARRFLWGRIAEAVKGGRCIVLTSHSMEECEALCTRLAIMVNGQFKCIGSPQHLKNKYGEGYTLTVKVGGLNPDLSKVNDFIKSICNAVPKESHSNTTMYQIPPESTNLSKLFQDLEENKSEMQIQDYSLSQTTLDEVFVSFAKTQKET